MTDIKDLELRIKSAESTLEILRRELEELRQQEQQEPESLFGRWATHPEYGRGIITSIKPDSTGEVRFAYRHSSYTDGAETRFARPESLTIDPATLTTAKDFEDAPVGTIAETITEPRYVYTKAKGVWYATGSKYYIPSHEMRKCRVIRRGDGQ